MQALVIGDLMLDIYQEGKISRISPEAPVPVVLNPVEHLAAGGAANVAVNLASMGMKVIAAGIIGQDHNGKRLQEILSDAQIETHLVTSSSQPTITKWRVIGNGHHLVRIDTEGNFKNEAQQLFEISKNLNAPWVVLSDYNKGSLIDIQQYIQHFKSIGSKPIIDPKRAISNYQNAWLIKPNKNEFINYIGSFENHEELITKARNTLINYQIENMLITLGSEGMMYVSKDTHQFYPTQPIKVADITGAGDTVIAGLVYGLSHGLDLHNSILQSKKWAEYAVTQIGTYVLTSEDISKIK